MSGSAPRASVVVVGAVNVDHVLDVERFPASGEGVHATGEHEGFGGKGGNAATAAARMGGSVRLVARVGSDDAGARALVDLAGEGVDISTVGRDDAATTGHATVIVDEAGQNKIVVVRGANELLTAEVTSEAVREIEPPGSCLISLEIPPEASLAAATAASRNGLSLIVDPAPPDRLPEGLLELGPILTPNEVEATALTGESLPNAAADALYAATRSPVIVTKGARGVLVRDRSGPTVIPSPAVLARDSTGAGDVLAGTLAVALAEGQPLVGAAKLAVAAAALSVTAVGARTAPTRASAERLAASLIG